MNDARNVRRRRRLDYSRSADWTNSTWPAAGNSSAASACVVSGHTRGVNRLAGSRLASPTSMSAPPTSTARVARTAAIMLSRRLNQKKDSPMSSTDGRLGLRYGKSLVAILRPGRFVNRKTASGHPSLCRFMPDAAVVPGGNLVPGTSMQAGSRPSPATVGVGAIPPDISSDQLVSRRAGVGLEYAQNTPF